MIVLDASALLELLLVTPSAAQVAKAVRHRRIHAPALIDLEVLQALRRYVLRRQLDPVRAAMAVEDLAEFPMTRHDHSLLIPRIWELRTNLTAYDAAYLALAEALASPLVTKDRGLAAYAGRSVGVHRIGG